MLSLLGKHNGISLACSLGAIMDEVGQGIQGNFKRADQWKTRRVDCVGARR